jgi:lysozyme
MTRRICDSGLACLRDWEGCKLDAYEDEGGVPTIGYGSTRGVLLGMSISQDEADNRLRHDLAEAEAAIDQLVRVPLTDNQHAVLVSFTFNAGVAAFRKSTLLHLLNERKYDAIPAQLMRWVHVKGRVSPGLTKRRAAEAALWSS